MLKYTVDLDKVGIGSANLAYGGFLRAYSFSETDLDSWINLFRENVCSKLGKEFLPVYRMADGEYRFLMGRRYNFSKKPYWKEILAYILDKTRIRDPNNWKTSWGEKYRTDRFNDLRNKLINDIQFIAKRGYLACYYNENGLDAFTDYNNLLLPFFGINQIEFNKNNYIPFHFVCSLLVRGNWKEFYTNRVILIVTGSDDFMERKIREKINSFGARRVIFQRISRTASMEELLDLTMISERIDLCLVAAGIGAANIIRQLEPLNTVTLDIGGYINCFVDEQSSQHGGIYRLPEFMFNDC